MGEGSQTNRKHGAPTAQLTSSKIRRRIVQRFAIGVTEAAAEDATGLKEGDGGKLGIVHNGDRSRGDDALWVGGTALLHGGAQRQTGRNLGHEELHLQSDGMRRGESGRYGVRERD